MTQEEMDVIYNKLQEIGRNDLAKAFMSNPDGFDYSVLESDPNFVEKYKNVDDFKNDKYKIMGNLYLTFDGKMPTKERFNQLQSQYPWLNKGELQLWFDKTNKYRDMYKKEREQEAGKIRRKREIDNDWSMLQNLLASEYSKQRYIDNPDNSMFGKEGTFNPYSSEGQEEIRDVILGGTGAVADLIPGWGALIGPTIRTGRDIYHAGSDSPYKKDVGTIWKDAGLDYGTNVGAWLLSNARKGAKMANEMSSNDVKRSINFANETDAIKEGLGVMETGVARIPEREMIDLYRLAGTADPFNDIVLKNTITDLPESSMKRELMPLVADIKNKPVDRKAVQEVIQKYQRETNPIWQQQMRKNIMENRILPNEARQGSEYFESALAAKPFSELDLLDKGSFLFNRLSGEINKGKLGQVLMQEGATASGRLKGTPKVVLTEEQKKEREDNINRIISTYSLLWNKKSPPPEAKDSPLIKEAWEKWSKE